MGGGLAGLSTAVELLDQGCVEGATHIAILGTLYGSMGDGIREKGAV